MNEPVVRIGDVEIHPILESVIWCRPTFYLPDGTDIDSLTRTVLEWAPVTTAEDGWVATYVRSYVVKADGQIGIVDAGVGQESPYEFSKSWRLTTFPYADGLATAGVAPTDVDWVVSTHLHSDHIGWYATLRSDGSWEPYFTSARHLIVRAEREHLLERGRESGQQRVAVVSDAGLCELIDAPYAITESVRLEPSTGHTPGHAYVIISSAGEEALITGDVLHHKLQLAAPDLDDPTDRGGDPEQALRTRQALFEQLVDTNTLMLAGHFEPPAAGYLRRHGDGYALLPDGAAGTS